jgi:hypothetical protein
MAAPAFGFSVGDFVVGIQLVKDLIKALNEAAGAKASYRRLIAELLNLDEALGRVRELRVDESQAAQKIALEQVATQCQESITDFLKRNEKFKATLGSGSGLALVASQSQPSAASPSRWRSTMHKIQWALLKDDDVEALRTQISAHTTTISLILNTMQL